MSELFADKLKSLLGPFLAREKDIILGYLFGSQVTGQTNAQSDIDIAFLLADDLSPQQQFDRRLELISLLGKLLNTDKVDLVILNNSPALITFRIISEGFILFERDEHKRVLFEARSMSMYYDQQYYYERHAKYSLDQMSRDGLL